MKKITTVLIVLLLTWTTSAARVGVVVDLPGQTYTKCATVQEDADAYEVIEETTLGIDWSYFGSSLGHGLCGIESTGCPSTNCYCDANQYWGFYVKEENQNTWTYSQVGFDGGSTCSEHYCAVDGEIIGLAYGAYGSTPTTHAFSDICCSLPGDEKPCNTITLSEVVNYISSWTAGKTSVNEVVDLINEWSST